MHAFDMVVLGSGGGPDETNLSGYLLKSHESSWEAGIIALEAGSGIGALARILDRCPETFGRPDSSMLGKDDERCRYSAYDIYSLIKCFLVTHAHLDHISSLVLSAGSVGGPRKLVYGSLQTLKDVERIFNGRLWPDLASWDEMEESCRLFLPHQEQYQSITTGVAVLMMPLNHGCGQDMAGVYDSTAYFIRHTTLNREFLFFGDVEPDSLARLPRNKHVWERAASKVGKTLDSIFIECSWPSSRSDETLYGHLNPQHLLAELKVLATEVVKHRREDCSDQDSFRDLDFPKLRKQRRVVAPRLGSPDSLHDALKGLRIYITHCKARLGRFTPKPIHLEIADQVRALVNRDNLGAEVIPVEQGMVISFRASLCLLVPSILYS
ncbi:cyclic-AMP phosphodiesterase [Neolentinus lepideus HHB14362 ss-1]|uniref:Cyclic-AMP phosphodiesterase n=1 Tax=Neolentinus lepideus HHB14362 ss-1 TaxID=1314782 RepID=A0A165T9Q6_9AGAM|nr:cyclic-AMP phosphodiesterase [Neolentinus lepideus HHB14362 ss-1]